MQYSSPRFHYAGDCALLAELGEGIDPEVNEKVRQVHLFLEEMNLDGVTEIVPAYRSLLIYYDPFILSDRKLKKTVHRFYSRESDTPVPRPRVYHVPTLYGGEHGPDLEFVASHNGLSQEEVIRRHTTPLYRIYMLGFTPGFCYLGGMDSSIATPRLENPRERIKAGSVGVAGSQTGIYPVDSPGGWRLIGSTPLKIFAPEARNPFLFGSGNYLRFYRVEEEEYREIEEEVKRGNYRPRVEEVSHGG